ncbi:MAG: glycoside hydrolase family 2 protein, partial [Planctomycetota bacterium]
MERTDSRRFGRIWVLAVACLVLLGICAAEARYKVADGPLLTKWAKKVSPKNALPEYPRPQMVRKDWQNLNGLWEYAIVGKDNPQPSEFDGEILVPYCVESALSGVMKKVGADNRLWYRRTFKISKKWKDKRVLLHFG